jgi:PTH1 family peptidyl-tRNA hydrolase
MFLITGLGNIGKEYESTPHNVGFLFLDILKERLSHIPSLQVSEWINEEKLFSSDICKVKKNGELIFLLQKPRTYMNRSGIAVRSVLNKFEVDGFVLIHDDLDIPLGKYKLQSEKSPKGHKGVISVEGNLGTSNFFRVRVGIDNRGERKIPGEEYVLQKYSNEELETLRESLEGGIDDLLSIFEF